jgi:hypothetical protein
MASLTESQDQCCEQSAQVPPYPGELNPQIKREKYWQELTDTEKIERMREIVKRQESLLGSLLDRISRVKDILSTHSHDRDGRIMKILSYEDYEERGNRLMGGLHTTLNNEIYF